MKLSPLFAAATTISSLLTYAQAIPTASLTKYEFWQYGAIFHQLTGAVEADDYLTFSLVETWNDCVDFCDATAQCTAFNIYHDNNGKDGSPLWTCALYELCHGGLEATNTGGQTQPDGSVNYITDSSGYCK